MGTYSSVVLALLVVSCAPKTEVELFVDGFDPKNVRFEVEDLGPKTSAELAELKRRPDVDGALLLDAGACGGPCRAAMISVFVHNHKDSEPPPVIRLKAPAGRPARQPIAFRGDEISPGRVGRIRWLVELWPEEKRLTATLSGSVLLVAPPGGKAADEGGR